MATPLLPAKISIIVPTYNECLNILELIGRIDLALVNIAWEVIVVDDNSPDGTADVVRTVAANDPRIRCLQRIGRRGLASACIEGVLSSSAEFVAVIDGDLQHDERVLRVMMQTLESEQFDIVVGSRYVSGGGIGKWETSRVHLSQAATRISRWMVPLELCDPMSGFFAARRSIVQDCVPHLSSLGFKILADLFASSPTTLRFKEIPFTFRERLAGESKLDNKVAWDFGMLLLDKRFGHIIPVRFLSFALIGGIGVAVHLAVLSVVFRALHFDFVIAQSLATLFAMVFNFATNNILTYRDKILKGFRWFTGLLSFVAACVVGAVANVGIANYFFGRGGAWVLSAFAGILVGAVWNYSVTSIYTWGRNSR